MPFECAEYHGNRRYWTRERVTEALQAAAREIQGPLPCSEDAWWRVKNGRWDLPGLRRIYEFYGGLALAWQAIGADPSRYSLRNHGWTEAEESYLRERAGLDRLSVIAAHLRRSYGAVRNRLAEMGLTVRANQGWLSAADVAREYQCPYHRVTDLLRSGALAGTLDQVRNCWRVDPEDITPEVEALLRAPKRTHTSVPPDVADYRKRYGLVKKLIGGKMRLVEARAA